MRAPWHLWVIGTLALLWNAGGAYDYIMMRTQNEAYMAMLTEEQLAMFADPPLWFGVTWAIGVWGAVLGAVLLLLRSRFATLAFAASLLGLIGSSLYTYVLADPPGYTNMTGFQAAFSIAIVVVLIGLFIYAQRMAGRGVLR